MYGRYGCQVTTYARKNLLWILDQEECTCQGQYAFDNPFNSDNHHIGGYLDYAWDWIPGPIFLNYLTDFTVLIYFEGVWRGGNPVPLQYCKAESVSTYTYSNQLSFILLSEWIYDR